jgi:hypothetical protein
MDSGFKGEFTRITNLIDNSKSFVFARYGDGEVMLMDGQSVDKNTQAFLNDKWSSNGQTKLGHDLAKTIKHKEWYYGIPCQCCNKKCKEYLLSKLNVVDEQITYANLWVNSNYNEFIKWVSNIDKANLICNVNANNRLGEFPFKINKYYPIPDDCVNYYENNHDTLAIELKSLVSNVENEIFLISAGPLSEIIIDILWAENKNNKYIDVGSSLDFYIHNKVTRPYMVNGNYYNKQICKL